MSIVRLGIVIFCASFVSSSQHGSRPLWTVSTGLIPRCSYENATASCCLTIDVLQRSTTFCLKLQLSLNELRSVVVFTVNGEKVLEQELRVGVFCFPLFVPTIQGCLDIYQLEGSLLDRTLQVCSRLTLNALGIATSFDLQCLRLEHGEYLESWSVVPAQWSPNATLVG